MNFGGDSTKAWKDIWCAVPRSARKRQRRDGERRGCGQGIGAVSKIQGAGDLVKQMLLEYADAKDR
jgi:nitronate monooxygenase